MNIEDYVSSLITDIADQLMEEHGWPAHLKGQYPDKWDLSDQKSIYSILTRTAESAVTKTVEALMLIDPEQEKEEREVSNAVQITNAMFIFLQTPPGVPMYVSDVKKWLEAVHTAGISDDTEVEGHLHLNHDVYPSAIEKIECLECGDNGDLLITNHASHTTQQDTLF